MTGTAREDLFRAEQLLKKGEYKDALELVETIAAREGLPKDDRLACSLLESQLRVKLGELEKALTLAEEVLQTVRGRMNLLLGVDALIIEAEVSWRSGNLDEGLGAVEEGEELLVGTRLDHVGEWEEQIKRRKGELLQLRGVI
ncbi:MAG: hypothetical protein ACE5I5_10815 [Candidatus Heimdallarchaeota archaeon]